MTSPTFPSKTVDLRRYLDSALSACDGAGKILNNHFGNLRNVEEKYQAGLVSDADRESENFIKGHLGSLFPDHDFLGEEYGLTQSSQSGTKRSGALWMIDPLDGTTNFIHQFPMFCISIGLELDGELVLGVVDAPKLGMRWHAIKGEGAFMNGQRLLVSSRTEFRDGLFATGFSSYDEGLEEQLALIAYIVRQTRGIRRAGAAALDLCFLAQGSFDVFWEKDLSPWDTAAGVVIAKEAGAVVTDMCGNKYDPRMKSILAATPYFHSETLKVLEDLRKKQGC